MENFVSNPSYRGEEIVASGSNLTPRIISTFFLLALQKYFISHPEYSWDPDDNKTEIDIHAEYEEDDNLEKSIPVIVVQSGPYTISPAGIGTGLANTIPQIYKRDGKQLIKNYILNSTLQFTVDGQIIVYIIGMSNDDVNELSFTVSTFFQMLRYKAASILQIQNIGHISVSPAQASEKKGWTNRHMAQLSFPYSFTVAKVWEPVDYGDLLKEILLTVGVKNSKIRKNRYIYPDEPGPKPKPEDNVVDVPSSKITTDKDIPKTETEDTQISDYEEVHSEIVYKHKTKK